MHLSIVFAFLFAACNPNVSSNKVEKNNASPHNSAKSIARKSTTGNRPPPLKQMGKTPEWENPKAENTDVIVETSAGAFVIALYGDKAPLTVSNFLGYVDHRHYEGTIFHRVKPDFIVQGGGYTPKLTKKTTKNPIQLETVKTTGLSNRRGTVAMARETEPNSAAAEFFINVKDNLNLDNFGGGYATFGEIKSGMDVVDKISAVHTAMKLGYEDVPVTPVLIKSIDRHR